jgi:hypothetical protein
MDDLDALGAWLQRQPLNVPLRIDGESVCLRLLDGGAELAVRLWADAGPALLQQALLQGFASACEFDAGLGIGSDGREVLLSRWLPGARGWGGLGQPLEELLNQVASWRAVLLPEEARRQPPRGGAGREERRMRSLLTGRPA